MENLFMFHLRLFVILCFFLTINSSFLNIEELQKAKYGVEISANPVLLDENLDALNTMKVTSKHGQHYQCVFPVVQFKTEESTSINATREEIAELLEPLNETCLYFLNGWWSYEVCFSKSIRQYHEEGEEAKNNISLGYYSGETDWSNVTINENSKSGKRYHSQFYNNGTRCDLTGEPRQTEIRFFCNREKSDYITRIDESSTCVYIITVYTNKLCNHSLFEPPRSPQKHSITCAPALGENQYKKFTESKKKMMEGEKSSQGLQEEDKLSSKPKLRSADILQSLAEIFNDKGKKYQSSKKKVESGSRLDWNDLFKTTKDILTKSFERVKNLQHQKSSLSKEGEDDENVDSSENKVNYRKTAKSQTNERKNRKENDVTGDNEDDYKAWNVDSQNDLDENVELDRSSTSLEKEISKKKRSKKGETDLYEELIKNLRIQYRFFKRQIDTLTSNMRKRVEKLDTGAGRTNPTMKKLVDSIKLSLGRLEEKQRIAEDAMNRLTDLYDAVMEDPGYLNANDELAGIRSTLLELLDQKTSKSDSRKSKDESTDVDHKNMNGDPTDYRGDEKRYKQREIQNREVNVKASKLPKIVSKIKKIMTSDIHEDSDDERVNEDRISVRVTKVKEKAEDVYNDKHDLFVNDDSRELEEINGNEEMKAATKKMENIVRKQLEEAGFSHEGKIKVKIITSKEALERVAGGQDNFQILTARESNEFKDLLSSLLGGNEEYIKEKKRQEVLADNYNLIWNENGFTSAGNEKNMRQDDEDDIK